MGLAGAAGLDQLVVPAQYTCIYMHIRYIASVWASNYSCINDLPHPLGFVCMCCAQEVEKGGYPLIFK